MLLAQLLVLAFTGILWWLARRDLSVRPRPLDPSKSQAAPTDTAELEQLCATLEMLVTRLSRRLDAVEHQLAASERPAVPEQPSVPFTPLVSVPEVLPVREMPSLSVSSLPLPAPRVSALPEPAPAPTVLPSAAFSGPTADPHSEPVYALFDAGTTDPVEIARRTGLGRGEVDLILSLRTRRIR